MSILCSQNFQLRIFPSIADSESSFGLLVMASKKGIKYVPLEVCEIVRAM